MLVLLSLYDAVLTLYTSPFVPFRQFDRKTTGALCPLHHLDPSLGKMVACIARLCNTNELYRLSPSPTCYSWGVGSKIPQSANGVVQSCVVVTQTKTNETDIELTLLASSRGAS
jgi:hypothetical protein